MHLRRALILIPTLLIPARALAQRPVGEYEPAPRYSTFNLALQLTGDPERGREVMASWGRMRALGGRGAWMPWLEVAAGVSPGNREVVEGVAMGPRLTLARAFPSQFVGFGKASRAEPYLVATAGMYMAGDFGDGSRWGGAPTVSGGFGFRVFQDRWNVDLSTLELVVERRFGVQDGPARLYLRFGRATAPRERRDRAPGTTLTGRLLPAPSPP
ncbi:hypothetical protein [Longimicrobium sp.]|uniref:hypothetical protein n=1 Tax=Longimicrobium sp. TaxID=2029185 RepID=UPI002BB28C61|nr:hypothetical protein [Longimicrobium sp.]HSU14601.1 hypothetical protein [Longimicrobium sp.]